MTQTSIYYEQNVYWEIIALSIYKIGLSFWCSALSLTSIYL